MTATTRPSAPSSRSTRHGHARDHPHQGDPSPGWSTTGRRSSAERGADDEPGDDNGDDGPITNQRRSRRRWPEPRSGRRQRRGTATAARPGQAWAWHGRRGNCGPEALSRGDGRGRRARISARPGLPSRRSSCAERSTGDGPMAGASEPWGVAAVHGVVTKEGCRDRKIPAPCEGGPADADRRPAGRPVREGGTRLSRRSSAGIARPRPFAAGYGPPDPEDVVQESLTSPGPRCVSRAER